MSRVPVFGQAVQAPIWIAPNADTRVSIIQVVPRPTTAAISRASNDPRSRRTVDPVGRGGAVGPRRRSMKTDHRSGAFAAHGLSDALVVSSCAPCGQARRLW